MRNIFKIFMILLLPQITTCMHVGTGDINEQIIKIGNVRIKNKLPQDIFDLSSNIHLEIAESFINDTKLKHGTITLSESSAEATALFIEAIRLQQYSSVNRTNQCLIDRNNNPRRIDLMCTQTPAEKLANSIDN